MTSVRCESRIARMAEATAASTPQLRGFVGKEGTDVALT